MRSRDREGAASPEQRPEERHEPLSPLSRRQEEETAASLTALLAGPSASRRRPAEEDGEAVVKSARARLNWSHELHGRFLAAVQHLGVNTAVPKTILQARAQPRARVHARCALGSWDTRR